MRIVYIAGRYRHYNADGTLNLPRMAEEVADEARWAVAVARAGHFWIAPLHNSIQVAALDSGIADMHYVDGDLALIGLLRPRYDGLLLRPGWRRRGAADSRPEWYPAGELNGSQGAAAEYRLAQQRGLVILEPISIGHSRVLEVLN